MVTGVTFPPLMSGEACPKGLSPLDLACQRAAEGVEAGLVTYDLGAAALRAALVLAPEVPLAKAVAMLPVCGLGFQNALGALAPPEIAVHLDWDGGLRVNGARCGTLRLAASTRAPEVVPDWLVVALDLALWPEDDEGGATPDRTALYAEGCAEVQAPDLLEAWARHSLHWITRWEAGEQKALHDAWIGLSHEPNSPLTQQGRSGSFLGVDEDFGLLLRDAATTHLIPLTSLLLAR